MTHACVRIKRTSYGPAICCPQSIVFTLHETYSINLQKAITEAFYPLDDDEAEEEKDFDNKDEGGNP